uniref:ATP synthase F0 subunit 8 n=1 Tax=Channa andrao TaxID=1945525 RepID=UPI0023AAA6D9|nr:ATP synthase F0 subunit 8 [Channa andrao]WCO10538.1 ATP synthase F0 subunit 8 [Channa andrao]
MPQLNPTPWFAILILTWLVLVAVVFPNILMFTFPNDPTLLDSNPILAEPWNWPWF